MPKNILQEEKAGVDLNCFDVMVEEHKNIVRMLDVIRKCCYKVLQGENVRYEVFYKIIDFIRNYADKHHHGKEERLLFNKMTDELGPTAEMIVKHGMLVEHDLGRLHVQELESAVDRVMDGDDESRLDIIANAIAYAQLLRRHIEKEDGVAYKYAQRNLAPASLHELDEECRKFEQDAAEKSIQEKYLSLLEELEREVQ